MGTKDKALVEASPMDRIWGVGLAANDPKVIHRRHWRGLNLLGEALVATRTHFIQKDGVGLPVVRASVL